MRTKKSRKIECIEEQYNTDPITYRIESGGNYFQVKVKLTSLWDKHCKVYVQGRQLLIAALRQLVEPQSNCGKLRSVIKTFTYSLVLPKHIDETGLQYEIQGDQILIKAPLFESQQLSGYGSKLLTSQRKPLGKAV